MIPVADLDGHKMSEHRKLGLGVAGAVACAAASCWGATQWTALRLGYQPALGTAWLEAGQGSVYPPWRLFEWWLAYGQYAPGLFAQGGLLAALGALVGAGGMRALVARPKPLPTTYGSARWADSSEVKSAGLRSTSGVYLGILDGRDLRHDGPEHVIALAPTRSGKGIGLVVPTLLSWTGSVVVHDVKAENWHLTAGWRAQFSRCLLFDPTAPGSARYNPLSEVRRGLHEVRDVQNIADILVDPDGVLERRSHWDKAAHALLVGVILHVLYVGKDKSLAGVAKVLADPNQPFEATLVAMLHTPHLGQGKHARPHPVVAQSAQEVLNKSENERSGVLSTALSFLSLYRDPLIASLTSDCDFQIADLIDPARPVSLYLATPPSDLSRTRPLMRLMLNQIGRRLTEALPKGPQPRLLLMLDEFAALGRLEFFETALAYLAGFGVRAYLIAQSLNQLAKIYGENSAILDNCHIRIVFACNDERVARRISEALGASTIQRAQTSHSGDRWSAWLSHLSISQQEVGRPLLTPGEVMQLPTEKAIILASSLAPILADKQVYFRDARFICRVLAPPAPRPRGGARPNPWGAQAGQAVAATPSPSAADRRNKKPDLPAPCASEVGLTPSQAWQTPPRAKHGPADNFLIDEAAKARNAAAMDRLRRLEPRS